MNSEIFYGKEPGNLKYSLLTMVLKLHITFLDINMCLVYKIKATQENHMEDLEH